MIKIQIEKLAPGADMPFDLLLIADEAMQAIGKYLYASDVYVGKLEGRDEVIAVFVIQPLSSSEIEIKNIAVSIELQDKGIGSYLIEKIKEIARAGGYRELWVGTPDRARRQINFYQKNGFVISGVKKDFFLHNYPEPIFEDGVMLKDMVMLSVGTV